MRAIAWLMVVGGLVCSSLRQRVELLAQVEQVGQALAQHGELLLEDAAGLQVAQEIDQALQALDDLANRHRLEVVDDASRADRAPG